jgi:chemotaxis protein MotD
MVAPATTQAASAQATNVPADTPATPRVAGNDRTARPTARTTSRTVDQIAPASTDGSANPPSDGVKSSETPSGHATESANAASGTVKDHDGEQKPAHAHGAPDADAFNPQIASSDTRPVHTVGASDVKASLDGAQPSIVAAQTTAPAAAPTTAAAATPNAPYAMAASAPVPVAGLAVEIVSQARDGKNRFEIRLDPAELGRIDVHLNVDRHGNVSSHLVVERSETLDLLRRDAPSLERALQDAGLKTDSQGMQFSLRQETAGRDQNGSNGSRADRVVIPDDVQPITAGATYGRSLGLGGGIDIRV